LKAIDLSHNQLSGISEGSFVELDRLEELDLADNQISCIDRNAFNSLKNLRYLSLSSNQLSSLPRGLIDEPTKLATLNLDDNPWVCDCRLNWLILWLQSTTKVRRSAASSKLPICMEPFQYQGQRLTSIRPLKCSGNEDEMETSAECLPSASWTCPTPCKCSDGIADCRNKKLTHIPSHFPADTTEIRLEQNHIEEVTPRAFVGYKRLRRIDLSNNEIRTLAPDAFRGLKTLTSNTFFRKYRSQSYHVAPPPSYKHSGRG
jgi:Leucine-rich repeat (LRR) protein